jgi:hypothetical protein
VDSSLPRPMTVAALNRAMTGRSSATEGIPILRSLHTHRTRSATPTLVRLEIPRPPSSLGRHTLIHDTLHLPPPASSEPVQMKARRSLSMS